ncbi:MAG: LacI family DNA-binding transcriptional regulator [Halanaerobiales bacterium]
MKNITIKDVAKAAGVSPSTVSRVISDSDRISDKTKKNVRKIMKKLGYHQNAIARSLVTQQANSIGLVMARPTQEAFANPFFPGIIQGIAAIAQKNHFSLVLSSTADYLEEREETLKMIRNRKVDGVILMASRINDELINNLLEYKFPFVLIGRSPEHPNIPIVNNDNIKATYNAVKYLIENGYKRIMALSGPKEYIVSQDRSTGYEKALSEYGYKKSKIMYTTNFTYQEGYRATMELKEIINDIDAIFAFDDMIALGALRAVQALDINVPEELAILGFNDDPMVSYLKPALSTVRIPIIEMGEQAAEMIIKMINEKEYYGEELIIPTELMIRESVL